MEFVHVNISLHVTNHMSCYRTATPFKVPVLCTCVKSYRVNDVHMYVCTVQTTSTQEVMPNTACWPSVNGK